jgi:adenylate kinase
MKLLIMGPPGAGKGTQSEKIIEDYNLISISTGDMFRDSYRKQESLGLLAMEFIRDGLLVSDEITNEIIRRRLFAKNAEKDFLLDGYPRTLNQAHDLDNILEIMDSKLDGVIKILLDDEIIIGRMSGRRVCSVCGATFHIKHKPSKKDKICDQCGGVLYQREDDKEESVLNRLSIYHEKTKPLVAYYKERNILFEVNGNQAFDDVYQEVKAVIEAIR